MQVNVSFSRLEHTINSLEISEKTIRKNLRDLQEIQISIGKARSFAIVQIMKRLKKQEEALFKECESLLKLQRVLKTAMMLYKNTEEEIQSSSDYDFHRFEERVSLNDLSNIQRLITQFFN